MRYLPDTNIWLALAVSGHPHHGAATRWLDSIDDREQVMMCRATQQSLLRLLTTAAVFAPLGDDPLTNVEAWAVADAFLTDGRISLATLEPIALSGLWRTHSSSPFPAPKVWMDSYLAAYASAAEAILVTNDAAFEAYSDLEVLIPVP